jgi:proteasome assembly chaperone (PAC2) family protein
MTKLVRFWKKPVAEEVYMFAGWRQWADAGSISSGLPEYLINLLDAEKIGEIQTDGYYLFQIPGTHHLVRPVVKIEDGYLKGLEVYKNEIYYAGDEHKGLVIFLGDEPHMDVDRYADAFFTIVHELKVKRVIGLGGVYGPVPYDKDREIGCLYSLPKMKEELSKYAVRFSNYEGGSSIGTYLAYQAERERVEFLAFYGFVPAYDFGQSSALQPGMRIENDFKAWYDILRRCNHMLDLGLNLTDLEKRSGELLDMMEEQISELEEQAPQLEARAYLEQVADEFTERSFVPLDDMWEQQFRDLFGEE